MKEWLFKRGGSSCGQVSSIHLIIIRRITCQTTNHGQMSWLTLGKWELMDPVWKFCLLELCNRGLSWPWSYGSWIYNYLCNQCLSSLLLWVRIPLRARCTTLCDKVCQWLAAGQWFSLGTPVSSTNKIDALHIHFCNWNIVESGVNSFDLNPACSRDKNIAVIGR